MTTLYIHMLLLQLLSMAIADCFFQGKGEGGGLGMIDKFTQYHTHLPIISQTLICPPPQLSPLALNSKTNLGLAPAPSSSPLRS